MAKDKSTSDPSKGKVKAAAEPLEEFYEIEQILSKRLTANGMMYLIKWKNFPDPKDYTWEPIQHLTEVQDLVREFNETYDELSSGPKQVVKNESAVKKTRSAKKQ